MAAEVDQILAKENQAAGVKHEPKPIVDDLTFLRRATVDIIGRIPTNEELKEFQSWPAAERRKMLVDKLIASDRFADRWTVFFADILRLRAGSPGGPQLTAYVHQAIAKGMPYDELARNLIKANGRATSIPEVGFILGDDANPLAMAAVTSQVFMGVRMGCAECHDHPFDVWKREEFYGLAAFYGKTVRVENDFTNSIYTTEGDEMAIQWPPMGVGKPEERKPVNPTFPFEMDKEETAAKFVERLKKLRETQAEAIARAKAERENSREAQVDAILDTAGQVRDDKKPASAVNVKLEAMREIRSIDINASLYRPSDLRAQLAKLVTDPRNRFFSRAMVNRVWAELIGRGFVEPVDDFRADNQPSHPETIDYLADEFVASGYDFRTLVRLVVMSDTYQRGHALGVDESTRDEIEGAFVATPMRVMLSEALFDSIVTAGHLFEIKHPQGDNMKTRIEQVRVEIPIEPEAEKGVAKIAPKRKIQKRVPESRKAMRAMKGGGYDLESAIEVDFNSVLKEASQEVQVEEMAIMSAEEVEAQMMMAQSETMSADGKFRYEMQDVTVEYDDNPVFTSAMRMPTPAPEGHFLRVFGQPARDTLGDLRDPSPSMRQALMILNGRITHEASRVGKMEKIYPLVEGEKPDLTKAIRLAYREILTREPSDTEVTEAQAIIAEGATTLEGVADLRWILLNCHEFRFIP